MNSIKKNLSSITVKTSEFFTIFQYSLSLLFSSSPFLSAMFILLVIIQGIMPTFSVIVGISMGNSIQSGNTDHIFQILVLWVITFVLPGVLAPVVSTMQSILNQRATFLTQQKIMLASSKINNMKIFENETIHNDFENLSREASNKPLNLLINLIDIFRDTITLISLSIVLSSVIWWMPFALLFPAFPVALTVSKSQKDIFKAFADQGRASRLIKYYISVLISPHLLKEIKIYGLSGFFMEKHKENYNSLETELNRIRKKQIKRPQIWNLLYFASALLVMYKFSEYLSAGRVSSGELLGVIQSVTYFAFTCQWGVYSLAYISVCFEFFRRLHHVENVAFSSEQGNTCIKKIPADKTIRLENISFAYKNNDYVLDGITFDINPGEKIALVGENGAGKSTLVKLICRLYEPDKGRITYNGIDIRNYDINSWRKNISAVFQDFGQYVLSIEENITIGDLDNAHNPERLRKACEDANFNLPPKISLHTLLGKEFSGHELSGGQWQKLALARALFSSERKLLVLDEPTSAMDPRVEADLFSKFNKLTKDRTSIIITHRMGSVKNVDRVIVLKNGKLIEQDSPDQLLKKKGEFYELHRIQTDLYKNR